jgi:type VI secretion system protein ImpJ
MNSWAEIHWSEGMFLRPHHLQGGQRWLETVLCTGLNAVRPFAWGFLDLQAAKEPLENFTLRLDRCDLRLKDGTWVHIPENTDVGPLDFKAAMESSPAGVEVLFGVPAMQDVRANSISLENPDHSSGSPRYEPHPVTRRDENTGANPQTVYVRKMRGRLFVAGQDTTGYEIVRLGRIRRTDRPGALPEFDELGAGPLLSVQASEGLSKLLTSLSDQVEAKDEVMAREAREHRMLFTDGVAANTEHLLKLHVLNESRAHLKALLQCPLLHPYDVYLVLARLVGHLSVFHDDLVPGPIPVYDHDRPGECMDRVRAMVVVRLEAMRPIAYVERPFAQKKDERGHEGLEVELDRKWIDENLEIFVAFNAEDMEINEVERFIKGTFDLKLASPKRAGRIDITAVSGLRFQIKAVPAGTLPRRAGLHYFKIDKTIGPDRTDYWRECEQERGIRMSIREGQMAAMERFRPTLYVVQRA